MLLAELVATSTEVAATSGRQRKVALLSECVRALQSDEIAVGVSFLAGSARQERLDVGWAALRSVDPPPAERPVLSLLDVDAALGRLVGVRGAGSRATRLQVLTELLGAATAEEQRFLRGLLLGELRQGALAGIAVQAIARATQVPDAEVRRAVMLNADLGAVAQAALEGGSAALAALRLTLFRPVGPMLAQTAADVGAAVREVGESGDDRTRQASAGHAVLIDDKLDGARVQVHRRGDELRVYTRNLRDVTARSADVAAVVAALEVESVVLDGEVVAVTPDGRPHAFQDTMRRFGTDATSTGRLTPFFFDCLYLDGVDLLDRPLVERAAALERVVSPANRVGRVAVTSLPEAQAAFAGALRRGHEGVVVKEPASVYAAGRRGATWRKVKPAHTLDLVVLAAEWGSGRRRGWLSNLHLGARDPGTGDFVMLGKTFKGLTDEVLGWQTDRLLTLECAREGHIVFVRPELVVEIAIDGVQQSSRYPGGVALRFARVKRYRPDKSAAEADTIDTVRAFRVAGPTGAG